MPGFHLSLTNSEHACLLVVKCNDNQCLLYRTREQSLSFLLHIIIICFAMTIPFTMINCNIQGSILFVIRDIILIGLFTSETLAVPFWTSQLFCSYITDFIFPLILYRGAGKSLARTDWNKNNWKVAIFRPTRRPGWTDSLLNCFWVACKSWSLVAVACFLPGRAKDLPAPQAITWWQLSHLAHVPYLTPPEVVCSFLLYCGVLWMFLRRCRHALT